MSRAQELADRLENTAFPVTVRADVSAVVSHGLTKRQLFAAMILQGYYASPRGVPFAVEDDRATIASLACQQADALLEELAK